MSGQYPHLTCRELHPHIKYHQFCFVRIAERLYYESDWCFYHQIESNGFYLFDAAFFLLEIVECSPLFSGKPPAENPPPPLVAAFSTAFSSLFFSFKVLVMLPNFSLLHQLSVFWQSLNFSSTLCISPSKKSALQAASIDSWQPSSSIQICSKRHGLLFLIGIPIGWTIIGLWSEVAHCKVIVFEARNMSNHSFEQIMRSKLS